MKKWLFVYWCDFFVMMLIPFILIISAKFLFYPILDHAPDLAKAWLAAAAIFLLFAIYAGIKIRRKSAVTPAAVPLRSNFGEIIFVVTLALIGIGLSSARKIFPPPYVWDIFIVYWIIFTFSILKVMQRFISRCRDQKILF